MASKPCPHCDGTIGVTSPDTCYKCGRSVFSKPANTAGGNTPKAVVIKDDTTDVVITLPSWLNPRAAPSLNLPQDRPLPTPASPPTPESEPKTQQHPEHDLSDTFEDDPRQLPLIELPSMAETVQRRPRSKYRPRMIDPSKLTQNALF